MSDGEERPVALVSGATRGLGLGLARALGEAGCVVIVTGRSATGATTENLPGTVEEAAAKGIETHAIHLGDVYYSGWAAEYDAHFLPFWPVLPEEASRHGSW